jgi:hypothetical protein
LSPRVEVQAPLRVGVDLTHAEARASGLRHTTWGFRLPVDVDPALPEQRIRELAPRVPPRGAVTGWAAARVAGARWLDGLAPDGRTALPVLLAVGPRGGVRRTDDIAVSFERLPPWEVWHWNGVPVARPERAVFDEMRQHPAREALVVLESALAAPITSLPRFAAYAAAHRSARRVEVVRWALARARGRVRSPLEVRVRTVAEEDAGFPRLLVNRVVTTAEGLVVGEVDLLDVEAGVVIEPDGAEHRSARRQAHDITKEEALRELGLEVTRVTGRQARDPARLAARLRATRARARGRRTGPYRLLQQSPDAEARLSALARAGRWWPGLR